MTARGALTPTAVRRCGLAAVVVAIASLPLAPLNALARMQTESGQSDLANELANWWAEPALRVLGPWLLDFADPVTVYLTYGMFYAVAMVGVLACVVAARSVRPRAVHWDERWGWRLVLASYGVILLGFIAFYYLRVGDGAYLVILFAMLIGIPGNILLGIGLLRGGFRPRFAACVILLDLPLSIALVEISTQALGMWPMSLAWGVIGWSLWRHPTGADQNGHHRSSRATRTATHA
ncbi:MAG TPA: hypothetical protein VFD59_04305 [Nocardioidaceae bacterium]|nr:hypothetical protein [Nocardioidaceae bacterium]